MFHRRKTYTIRPERLQEFTEFFHTYLYPIQVSHGARLVGRWVTEDQTEVMALWEYRDREHYEQVERDYRSSALRREAMKKRARLGKDLYIKSSEEFMMPTGHYTPPRTIVSVTAYITNDDGEVLLVKNTHRSDTYEMPGGQVEEHESIIDAIHREVKEETGADVEIDGIIGIYQNVSSRVLCVSFHGRYVSGDLRPQAGETHEVGFFPIDASNVSDYIKRDHFQMRLIDAIDPTYIPHAIYKVRPYELLERVERHHTV
ncbi:NUDIX hydrolase [Exiguobacterium sp. SH31]|uniref:NUDIX domain-containing protein n=1 Tax=unclassified Exiguobacterium TaxID=2644629 RepID=UPI0008D05FE3|nr:MULTISPECIES: NUDIX domain-containing protein [unclassified Exiguobacterium]OGX78147.1 NUDIX hydrolase [Exiguobacterium sp. SH31]TCI72107.1 NUDIX domain-containing protein [Exiguobacterium sp. SH0S7]